MNSQDPLTKFRDLLGAPRPVGQVPQERYAHREKVGGHPRFKNGQQEIWILAVGHERLNQIILETVDRKGSEWKLSRWLPLEIEQLPALLQALLDGEVCEANISAVPPSTWPEFPIPLADIPCSDGGVLKVVLDSYNGFRDIKLSFAAADGSICRNNLWAKFSPVYDVRPIIELLIQAYDEIMRSPVPVGASSEPVNEIGF